MQCIKQSVKDVRSIGWGDGKAKNRMTSCFIPTIINGELRLPPRGRLPLRLKGKGGSFSKRLTKEGFLRGEARQEFSDLMCTYLGVSRSMANIIASRHVSVLRRIEEEIMGIFDSFLLAFPEWFVEPSRFNHIVKVCYAVGCFDLDQITRWFKQFTNYIWVKASATVTLSEPVVDRTNPFKRYLPLFSEMLPMTRKCQAEALIHFVSTRQLVSGSAKTEKASIEKFVRTTSNEFKVEEDELRRISHFSKKIGSKVLRLMDGKLPTTTAHISLSGAGDYNCPVRKGGRCHEIIENITPTLTRVATETKTWTGPLGITLCEREGVPVWRTWCRELECKVPHQFGEMMIGYPKYWNDDRRAGFDHAIGYQIFVCALFEYERWKTEGYLIPCRSVTVPEPGGKARIVTTTLWWVIVLMQPAGAFLKECLQNHPSAKAGLQRADQAWLYIDQLAAADMSTCTEPVWFLSSDLSEATDAIPPPVANSLIRGFIEGLGVDNPLLNIAIELAVCPRQLETRMGHEFVKKRGVLMGEGMTKSILTLLNLCVEEAAIRDYLGVPEGPVTVTWRSYSVGGDDHIAAGPRAYLEKITENHVKWGSIISPDKHGMSQLAVRYCEKALWFKDSDLRMKARLVNSSAANYERSIFVDSVKVRLLSPVSKSFEIENDRNIAIGKAKSFGRTLRWLSPQHFPLWWVKMVRDRFWSRMRDYLPKIGTSLYYHLLLPAAYGGLDLYLKGELQEAVENCPLPTRQFIYKLMNGQADRKLVNRFKRFCSNDRMRGQDFAAYLRMATEEYDFDELGPLVALPSLEPMTIWEARDKAKLPADLPMREVVNQLNRRGFHHSDQIVDLALRPTLFNEMLAGKAISNKWNTTAWTKRYAELWDDVLDKSLGSDFVIEDLKKVEKPEIFIPLVFYDVNTRDYDDEESFIEAIDDGLPTLFIPFWDTAMKNFVLRESVPLDTDALIANVFRDSDSEYSYGVDLD